MKPDQEYKIPDYQELKIPDYTAYAIRDGFHTWLADSNNLEKLYDVKQLLEELGSCEVYIESNKEEDLE